MAKRTRNRARPKPKPPPPVRASRGQEQIEDMAVELLALWRAMPYALARDSAGLLTGDRHAVGGSKGSAASVNIDVVDASVIVETGIAARAVEAVAILNLDRAVLRSTVAIIEAFPDWHRSLEARKQPLAVHIVKDMDSWLRQARGAIGIRKHDRRLGPMCPDHRDNPAPLLEVGAQATLAKTLVDGPPPGARIMLGPTCPRPRAPYTDDATEAPEPCSHRSCTTIRERRLVTSPPMTPPTFGPACAAPCTHRSCKRIIDRLASDRRIQITDWVRTPSGDVWLPLRGEAAYTWVETGEVRCPACKRTWSKTEERLLLARELAAGGDARPSQSATEVMVTP